MLGELSLARLGIEMLDDLDHPLEIVQGDAELPGQLLEMPHREVVVEFRQQTPGQGLERRIQIGHFQLDNQAFLERTAGNAHRIQHLDLLQHGFGLVHLDRRAQCQIQVLDDRRNVATQVAVLIHVADDLLAEQDFLIVEIEEAELLQQAVIQGNAVGNRVVVFFLTVEDLPGLVPGAVVIHVVFDRVFLLFRRLVGLFHLLRSRLFGGCLLFRLFLATASISSSYPSSRRGFISSSALIFCSSASVGSCSIFRYCTC